MAASLSIEEESGVFTGRTHPHNGYFAGDLSPVLGSGALPAPAAWSNASASARTV